jgi:hypothetical protein
MPSPAERHKATQAKGYDTNHDWKGEQIPQVIDFMVELVGIELCRSVESM